jgi:hypothetical protein
MWAVSGDGHDETFWASQDAEDDQQDQRDDRGDEK